MSYTTVNMVVSSDRVITTKCFYNINVGRMCLLGLMARGRKAITLVKQTKPLWTVNIRIFKARFVPKSSLSYVSNRPPAQLF